MQSDSSDNNWETDSQSLLNIVPSQFTVVIILVLSTLTFALCAPVADDSSGDNGGLYIMSSSKPTDASKREYDDINKRDEHSESFFVMPELAERDNDVSVERRNLTKRATVYSAVVDIIVRDTIIVDTAIQLIPILAIPIAFVSMANGCYYVRSK
ncbi:27315_t:CDS:2 [Gigaspora margarita]|uniref:27315_t:CDS:1 n=1 Tax=Gigaspora margarita TaxID=4874 RepID=A0ABN7UIE1_GIGMA|nr:27315_t:CDS:2 [Gigaspora margarita]